jgi:hypothetical protein
MGFERSLGVGLRLSFRRFIRAQAGASGTGPQVIWALMDVVQAVKRNSWQNE